jgi:hypothetical protein
MKNLSVALLHFHHTLFSFQGAAAVERSSIALIPAFWPELAYFALSPLPRKPAYAGLCSDLVDVFQLF